VARRSPEHQQELKRRHRLARQELQSCRFRRRDHRLRIHSLVRRRSRSAPARIEPGDAQPALELERSRDVTQHHHWIVHLVIGVDDEDGVDARRQTRIGGGAEHGAHVLQSFALQTAADRFDHLRLNVLGIDEAVRPHPSRQPNREPATAGAKVGHHRSFRNQQRIHDLIRLLPQFAIGRFEETKILRLKQARLRLFGGRGLGRTGRRGWKGRTGRIGRRDGPGGKGNA
jgi:hypothetical protein